MAAAAPATTIRPVRAELLGLSRERVAIVTIIADDRLPEIIMFNGDPFLLDVNLFGTAYRQVRPFRADIGGA